MNVYKLNPFYCNYLHDYEAKIPYIENEKESRPFVGTVLYVNGKNFFAPLTSPKSKHLTMKDSQDFLKIDGGKLGGINLNNMMPIPQNYLHEIDIKNIRDSKYKRMLFKQLNWIQKNSQRINNRARCLYYLVSHGNANADLINRCCNFELLEEKRLS